MAAPSHNPAPAHSPAPARSAAPAHSPAPASSAAPPPASFPPARNTLWWLLPTVVVILALAALAYFLRSDEVSPFFYGDQ
ncbi:MAG: DUF5989 family protein [Planctomycetota bacterium]